MVNKKNSWSLIFISAFCMVVVLYILYFIKGIFPFGANNISYYDMSQYYVPIYYHIYDALHGTKAFFFDWYSGAGGSMADHLGSFMLNPLNLLMYFVPRNQILNLVTVFLVIKVAFSAGAMSFYSTSKYSDLNALWHVVVGVLYASSGYFVQYYTNIQFLDIVAVFPILIWSFERMIYEKKVFSYIVVMSYCFLMNFYFSGLFCPFLVFYGVILVKNIDDKSESRKAAWRIGIYTIASILISGIITVPTYTLLLGSGRSDVSSEKTYFDALTMMFTEEDGQKHFMLYGSELPIAIVFLYCVKKGKEGIKEISDKLLLLFALLVPIWIESVNYILHIIGYVMFPMRFGYVLTFFSLIFMEDILQKNQNSYVKTIQKNDKDESHAKSKGQKRAVDLSFLGIIALVMVPVSAVNLYMFSSFFLEYGIADTKNYSGYFICFLSLLLTFALVILSKRKKMIGIVVGSMVFFQVLIGWYGFLAPQSDYYPESSDDIIVISELIRNGEKFETDEIDRIKDRTVMLNSNFPFVMQKASMSNWTWGINNRLSYSMSRMGYSSSYTRILDTGGTLYSDMLLNIKEVITQEEPDSDLYTVYDNVGGFYLSKMNYEYPFAIYVNEDFTEFDKLSDARGLCYQNELFKKMTGSDKDLISVFQDSDFLVSTESEESGEYSKNYSVRADGRMILYMEPCELFNNVISIKVNEHFVDVPSIEDTNNKIYPSSFNNGIIECGFFEDETISVSVIFKEKQIDDYFFIGLFDIDVLEESVVQLADETSNYEVIKNRLRIEKRVSDNGYVFLPVGYKSNVKVTVNETEVLPKAVLDSSFICVPVEAGSNVIELTFRPSGFGIGAFVSFVGILISVFSVVLRDKIEKLDLLMKSSKSCLYGLAGGILLLAYAIPILVYFIFLLTGKYNIV